MRAREGSDEGSDATSKKRFEIGVDCRRGGVIEVDENSSFWIGSKDTGDGAWSAGVEHDVITAIDSNEMTGVVVGEPRRLPRAYRVTVIARSEARRKVQVGA